MRQETRGSQIISRQHLLAAAVAACFSASAYALPLAPTVVHGAAGFAQSGNALTVTNSAGAIINWQKFGIAAGEITRFIQPSASSAVLNQVVGVNGVREMSQIHGTLSSNGKVWLINPAGILVGASGVIDTAGFIASALNVRAEDFLAGRLNFQATPGAGDVVNRGTITTPTGGSVYLVGTNVSNEAGGVITTPGGETVLAAGVTVDLLDTSTPGVKVEITGAANNATNLGSIVAEAGRIGIAGTIVRNAGTLDASSVVNEGGRIFLKASQDTFVDGAGRIVSTGTKGGQVEVLGNRVAVMDQASIDVSGTNGGGTIKVGGDYQGKNPDIQNAQITFFGPEATLKANALEVGDGGTVIVWADDTTRAYGHIEARGGATGGNGGFVETSGKQHLSVNDIQVDTGGGQWLLDPPDFIIAATGGDINGATLSSNLASNNVTILSSAGASGVNGDIFVNDNIVWSSGFGLTLSAYRNINVNSVISASGNTASLTLTPNTGGLGGSYGIGSGGRIDLSGSSPSLTIAGQSYTVINSLGVFADVSTTTLQGMKNNLAGRYALGSNIDASATSGWDGGNGFLPVGTFTGVFDGLGHTITGLTINRPTTDYIGLFGYTTGATIRNVGLNAATITGQTFVGSLVGRMDNGNISSSYSASATITGTSGVGGGFVGGLVGWYLGNISNSYSTGSATGVQATGGLFGANNAGSSISNSYSSMNVSSTAGGAGGLAGGNDGNISKSYSTGTVTGSTQAGGLVGQNHAGNISDSYSTGNVIGGGSAQAGGLVGRNGPFWTGGTTITNSYSTGQVSGSVAGGLVGLNEGTVPGSFWNTQTSGQSNCTGSGASTGCSGLTTAQMQTAAIFTAAGWSTANWNIADGNYPTLKNMPVPPTPPPACPSYSNCWTGALDSLWATAGNWSAGHTPTGTESVKIDVAGTPTISIVGINPTFGSLWLAENLDVDAGVSFTLNNLFTLTSGAATFDGTASVYGYAQTGGTLAGSGAFTVTNNFTQTGGAINRTGNMTITQASGALNFSATQVGTLLLYANTINLGPVSSGNYIQAEADSSLTVNGPLSAATSSVHLFAGQSTLGTMTINSNVTGYTNTEFVNAGGSINHTGGEIRAQTGYVSFDNTDAPSGSYIALGSIKATGDYAGHNYITITSKGQILDNNGSAININADANKSLTLTSAGGAPNASTLAISVDTTGAFPSLSATAGGTYGEIDIRHQGNAPSNITLTSNATEESSVTFEATGDIILTSGSRSFTTNGCGIYLLAGGNLTTGTATFGGNPDEIGLYAANTLTIGQAINTTGWLGAGTAININQPLTAPTNDLGIAAGVSKSTARTLADNNSDLSLSDFMKLPTTSAGNININSTVTATNGDVGLLAGGNITLNEGSTVIAGNDVLLELRSATSKLDINPTAGTSGTYIWAKAPSTIYLTFTNLASGGVFINGMPSMISSGYNGLFFGPGFSPASPGYGLILTYGAASSTLINTITNTIIESTSEDPTIYDELPTVENIANADFLITDETIGGGDEEFGEGEVLVEDAGGANQTEDDPLNLRKKKYAQCKG